ncbi:MAG: hypothetical protein EGR02_05105 [Clostridiales bacterium]|nr:hypothetical protein [Clostridiales bacterium]
MLVGGFLQEAPNVSRHLAVLRFPLHPFKIVTKTKQLAFLATADREAVPDLHCRILICFS